MPLPRPSSPPERLACLALAAAVLAVPAVQAGGGGSGFVKQFGCESPLVVGNVPIEEVRDLVPDSLDVVHRGAGELAIFGYTSWSCERSVVDGETLQDTGMAVLLVSVDPPDKWEDPGVGAYWYPTAIVADDAAEADRYADWNLPAAEGTVSMTTTAVHPNPGGLYPTAAGAWSSTADGPGFTASIENSHATVFTSRPIEVRYFAAQDGEVTNAVDFNISQPEVASYYNAYRVEISGSAAPDTDPQVGLSYGFDWQESALSHRWTYEDLDT